MGKVIKQEIVAWALVGIYFIAIAYLSVIDVKGNKSLTKHKKSCHATITGFSIGTKMKSYIDYQFLVGQRVYKGHGRPFKGDTFVVGDSILIVYDSTNLENNMPKRQYDRIANILK